MPRNRLLALTLIATSFFWVSPGRADDTTPVEKPAQPQTSEKPAAAPAGQGTTSADFNNDGRVDLFVTSTVSQATAPSQPQPLSEYWIGIDGVPPDDALRAQLELPAGQGLLINQVVEASPAAKAGLKQHDVLLTCHDMPLAQISDLAKIIEEKKGTTLALRLVRGGKRIIVEATPERRPASQTGETCPSISKSSDEEFARRVWLDLTGSAADQVEIENFVAEKREKKRDWLVNRLLRRSTIANKSCTACHANDGDSGKLYWNLTSTLGSRLMLNTLQGIEGLDVNATRLWGFPYPLVQLQGQALNVTPQPLADDVTVTVSRKGQEPARISVRKGDRIWEFGEQDDREKLPEEVRALMAPFASSLTTVLSPYLNGNRLTADSLLLYGLNGSLLDVGRGLSSTVLLAAQPAPPEQPKPDVDPKPATPESAFDRLDKQVESLSTQLGELRRAMQELRQSIKPAQGTNGK
ncbi:MAG TPA: PDZ domain-containing protein [Planctomycetaceae bacterium]